MKPLPYETRLAVAMERLQLTPGIVSTARVEHDTGCPILAGKSTCRCSPDVFIETAQGRIEVMPDGGVRLPSELN
jgi:hypothetical protein